MTSPPRPLAAELDFFEEHRAKWLTEYAGKYALLKGRELVGTFDTPENAYVAGVEKFGNVPFLIKKVEAHESPAHLPALTLGLIRADA